MWLSQGGSCLASPPLRAAQPWLKSHHWLGAQKSWLLSMGGNVLGQDHPLPNAPGSAPFEL